MDRTLQDFEDSVIACNVVARVVEATEFPTEEARKKYLESHPKANPANHTVRKHKTRTQFNRSDKSRWEDVLKNTKDLKAIGEKATKGDDAAKAEVAKRYTTLVDHGESMADDAKSLTKKLKGSPKLSDKAKEHLGELEKAVKKWDSISHAAQKAKGRGTDAQLAHANEVMSAASAVRTLTHWFQDQAVQDKAMKRSADEWKVDEFEVTAASDDENKFQLRFDSIEEATKEMQAASKKYFKDPGRMKPQLDNLADGARRVAQDIRTIQRLLEPLQK